MPSRLRPLSQSPRRKDLTLKALHPNAGLEARYRERLTKLIEDMHASVIYWIKAAWRANPPKMAQDASSAFSMRDAMEKLADRWNARFDVAAEQLADYFAKAAADRTDAALRKILKDGGFAIEWRMTPAQREIIQATVEANVSLIKSIPAQHLGQVQQLVMQSVQTGRDLETLTKALEHQFGVTKRRAAFIARDQNNKATAALRNARSIEIAGVDAEEQWVHSGGGRHPRPTHVAAGRERVRYRISEGWYDPALKKHIWPGTEPNCRCVGRLVIKGFT